MTGESWIANLASKIKFPLYQFTSHLRERHGCFPNSPSTTRTRYQGPELPLDESKSNQEWRRAGAPSAFLRQQTKGCSDLGDTQGGKPGWKQQSSLVGVNPRVRHCQPSDPGHQGGVSKSVVSGARACSLTGPLASNLISVP